VNGLEMALTAFYYCSYLYAKCVCVPAGRPAGRRAAAWRAWEGMHASAPVPLGASCSWLPQPGLGV
jgi:hypothetical protein